MQSRYEFPLSLDTQTKRLTCGHMRTQLLNVFIHQNVDLFKTCMDIYTLELQVWLSLGMKVIDIFWSQNIIL